MDYEILIIGTELTSAQSEDKNARYIIEKLFKNGFECKSVTILPDEIRTIARSILNALYQSDILIISGGLGPTFDDVTREAISEATGKQLIFSQEIAENIKIKFKEIKKPTPQTALRQAYFPEGATLIPATLGTAPGIILEIDQKLIVALPGVPAEMRKILNENVVPFLTKKYPRKETILLRTIKTCGIGEVFVEKEIEKLIKKYSDVTTTILAHPEEVHIKLMVKNLASEIAKDYLSTIEKDLVECLGNCVFGYDEDTLESVVGKLLKETKLTIATAESCTGGLLSHRITNVPGSSDYFLGGVVAYSNEVKQSTLGIEKASIQKTGAVSEEVARIMAEKIRVLTNSDIGVGITGIAGPTGGSKEKPVGLVYIALYSKSKVEIEEFNFKGEREIIKYKATQAALNLVRKFLISKGR